MPVLGVDTSSAISVAVVGDDGTVLASASHPAGRQHAERLAPLIEQVLVTSGVDRSTLAVAVGTGPAPFTGLRVGLVTARMLALSWGTPLWGVPSLDALAARAAVGQPVGTRVLVATDALRKEVYWAVYEVADGADGAASPAASPAGSPVLGRLAALLPTVSAVVPPSVGPAADAAVHLADGLVVVGSGAALWPEILPATLPELVTPDAADIAVIAAARAAVDPSTVASTEPLYLRRPDAVPSVQRKRVLT